VPCWALHLDVNLQNYNILHLCLRSSTSGLSSAPRSSMQQGATSPGQSQAVLPFRFFDTNSLPLVNTTIKAWPGPPSSPQRFPSRPFSSSSSGGCSGREQMRLPHHGMLYDHKVAEAATPSPDFKRRSSVGFSKPLSTHSP
jgi:hypothetical protein